MEALEQEYKGGEYRKQYARVVEEKKQLEAELDLMTGLLNNLGERCYRKSEVNAITTKHLRCGFAIRTDLQPKRIRANPTVTRKPSWYCANRPAIGASYFGHNTLEERIRN